VREDKKKEKNKGEEKNKLPGVKKHSYVGKSLLRIKLTIP
jgi:hypothetical protein